MALKNNFGDDNIAGLNFSNNIDYTKDNQEYHLQCLNVVVYTELIHKSTYIFGRQVGFIPHKKKF